MNNSKKNSIVERGFIYSDIITKTKDFVKSSGRFYQSFLSHIIANPSKYGILRKIHFEYLNFVNIITETKKFLENLSDIQTNYEVILKDKLLHDVKSIECISGFIQNIAQKIQRYATSLENTVLFIARDEYFSSMSNNNLTELRDICKSKGLFDYLPISGFFIHPILYFKELNCNLAALIKSCGKSHQSRNLIEQSIASMTGFVHMIREECPMNLNYAYFQARRLELYHLFQHRCVEILDPDRRLLKEISNAYRIHEDGSTFPVKILIFNDMIMLCKELKNGTICQLVAINALPMTSTWIIFPPKTQTIQFLCFRKTPGRNYNNDTIEMTSSETILSSSMYEKEQLRQNLQNIALKLSKDIVEKRKDIVACIESYQKQKNLKISLKQGLGIVFNSKKERMKKILEKICLNEEKMIANYAVST